MLVFSIVDLIKSIGRLDIQPDNSKAKLVEAEVIAKELREQQIKNAARIRLLELQATPRGERHDRS